MKVDDMKNTRQKPELCLVCLAYYTPKVNEQLHLKSSEIYLLLR
jgi:hypothetical protein